MYRVIKYFTDMHDKDHPYHEGDIFPRDGIETTEERLVELSGSNNKQETPLIELAEVPEEEPKVEEEPAKKPSRKKAGAKASEE